MERFLKETALAAMEEVRSELAQHGREARVEAGSDFVSITVLDPHGHEEFFYSIRIRTYRPFSFAFPEFDVEEGAKSSSRAEVVLRSGPASHDVSGLDKEQLIRHFLHEYRKWIGWRTAGEPS